MPDPTPLKEFTHYGMQASYHYADDSAKEWGLAREAVSKAMLIYRAHPECREEMRAAGKEFLWAMDFKLKAEKIDNETT
jgi:hypothetical protein